MTPDTMNDLAGLVTGTEWPSRALCAQVDPELFFPEKGDHTSSKQAKTVCRRCQVQQECLAAALEQREMYGVWGGTSEKDRRSLLARGWTV